jgi:hypothetical protein
MAKVQKNDVSGLMGALADSAPLISFCVASLAFLLVGAFKADYYSTVLLSRWGLWANVVGIAIALVTESARAVLLLLSFADFRKKNMVGGWLGLVLSLGLVLYDCSGAGAVGALWIGEHTGRVGAIIRDVLVFLVVLSFGIEFRLVLSRPGVPGNTSAIADTPGVQATPGVPGGRGEPFFTETVKQNGKHVV